MMAPSLCKKRLTCCKPKTTKTRTRARIPTRTITKTKTKICFYFSFGILQMLNNLLKTGFHV